MSSVRSWRGPRMRVWSRRADRAWPNQTLQQTAASSVASRHESLSRPPLLNLAFGVSKKATMDISSVTVFHGNYAGSGFWVDVAGESKRYRIAQTIDVRESEICIRYEHDFFEEGTKSQGTFVLLRASEQLLSVRVN